MHTCIHAKHCVNWLCNPRCLPRLASNWHLTGIGWASPVWRCLIWNRVLLTTLLIDWVSSSWLVYTSRFCIMCFNHVDASRCVSFLLLCVWLSSLYGCHVTVCIACISPESSKIVTFSAKKSLGCYHHRDILRFPAILVEKSDDFCYNRDEKRPKRRVSRVLSHPQVVGNAITSTIATLHRHKKG